MARRPGARLPTDPQRREFWDVGWKENSTLMFFSQKFFKMGPSFKEEKCHLITQNEEIVFFFFLRLGDILISSDQNSLHVIT